MYIKKYKTMKKITLLTAFLISFAGFSQVNRQKIQSYLDSHLAKQALTSQDVSDWAVKGETSSTTTNITNYGIVQNYQGIEVFDTQSSVWVKNDEVINLESRFKSNIAQKVNTTSPSLTVIQAVQSAYNKLNITNPTNFSITETLEDKSMRISDGVQEDPIVAQLGYQVMADNSLKLAWGLQFYSLATKHYNDVKIDAISGQILDNKDLTISCGVSKNVASKSNKSKYFNFESNTFNAKAASMLTVTPGNYRAIPYNYESPNEHSFDLITTTGDALASPNGWHDANNIGGTTASLKYTYTRGNNILAQEDANGDNGTGARPDGGATLTFDFPYGGPTALPTSYVSASTTNLFYMTNFIHDVWYKYGFDETNHNFQQNNLGRGGTTSTNGDAVYQDSQDGYSQTTPTLNNSNFTPTADGVRPREQMFLWNLGAPPTNYLTVNTPSSIAGPYPATQNVFNTTDSIPIPVAPNGITADLVHYTNAINPVNSNPNPLSVHNACVAPTNGSDISGKIALIRRGNCNFSNKVFNAQQSGAIAAIVYDSIPNNPQRLSMSSTTTLGITIPAIFITKEIADQLIAELANGAVNVKIEVPSNLYLYADADFDNTIIGHEYGHGISNRLIGHGAAGCMTNAEQMGEGWSDWFGLLYQIKPGDTGADSKGVGNYVINEPPTGAGIRIYPYSTDMTINPHTLSDSNVSEVHDMGEVWTTVLWDLTWAYIDKYGFDPDIYHGTGGNNKVMQLVIDALKLQTCNTASFISGRDNLIAADQATTGGQDYCLITQVFTRRGMGLNASSGDANNALDQVEDFTDFPAGPNCTLAVNYFNDSMIRVYPNPSNGQFNVRINNFVGKVNIQVVDINGRVVLANNNLDFNIEKAIDLSSVQAGMYILKVTGDNLNYSEKIFKN